MHHQFPLRVPLDLGNIMRHVIDHLHAQRLRRLAKDHRIESPHAIVLLKEPDLRPVKDDAGLKRKVGHSNVIKELKGMGHPYAAYRTRSVRCCETCVSESKILKFEQLGKVGEIAAAILRH